MFNALFSLFKREDALIKVSSILDYINDILHHFDKESLKDKNTRNIGIDAVIEILQQYKD